MTNHPHPLEPSHDTTHDAALLERALQQALQPPALPDGFRARLTARLQSEQTAALAARRQQLAHEYEQQRQQLRADYVRLRRDRLAIIIASSFAAGVCVSLLLPWLYRLVGSTDSVSLTLAALASISALVAGIWLESFGRPKLPGLDDR